MSTNSSIEWTDATWNPTTGCRKVSPGCDHPNCRSVDFERDPEGSSMIYD
jgi:protein gp37